MDKYKLDNLGLTYDKGAPEEKHKEKPKEEKPKEAKNADVR